MADNPVVSQAFNTAGAKAQLDDGSRKAVFSTTSLSLSASFGKASFSPKQSPATVVIFEEPSPSQSKDAPQYVHPALPEAVAARNDKIRLALLEQAQLEFRMKPLDSAYGRELKLMQDQVNAKLMYGETPMHYKMAFIDPVRYDIGGALNLGPQTVVTDILGHAFVFPDNSTSFNASKQMRATPYNGKYASGRRENASAFVNNFDAGAEVCVVVPSSDIAPVDIPGMPYNAVIDYVNRHESFHCRDSKYSLRGHDPQLVSAMEKEPQVKMIGDAKRQAIFDIQHKREVFADVASIAEMVRNGNDPKMVLGPLKAWRAKEGGHDISHYTTPGLVALEKAIKDMGLQKFRALDDAAMLKLCYQITDDNALKTREIDAMLRYRSGTDKDKAALRTAAKKDPEIARALSVENDIARQLAKKPEGWKPLTPAETALDDQVRAYPASQLLQDRAFKDSGRITPSTMVKAYAALHDELRLEREWEPDNPVHAAKMTKLQHTLQREVRIMDYAWVNQQRGVKIENVEPVLASFKSSGLVAKKPVK